jgi:5-methylcytosine-specific restriction endonuclease McrA|tara:strand:+ start:433 stop:777 length:345 start_codon:yes stop_codon:yes gene_type:complete
MKQISDYLFFVIKSKYPEVAQLIIDENSQILTRYIKKEIRYELLKIQKWKCNQCGCQLKYSNESSWKGEIAHIDHIHPYSKRDTYVNGESDINELSNLQALCPKCNLTKSDKEK